jgi:hypothetical protein
MAALIVIDRQNGLEAAAEALVGEAEAHASGAAEQID